MKNFRLSILILASAFIMSGCGNDDVTNVGTSNTPVVIPADTPSVSVTVPVADALDITLNRGVSVTFVVNDGYLDSLTVNDSTFFLKQGSTFVDGTVSANSIGATFTPLNNLMINTIYTATVTTGVMSISGSPLLSDKVWSFTTGIATAGGPAPVNLRSADAFAILSKSGISSVPSSVVTGNIGVSPATGVYITGFTCVDLVAPYKVISVGSLAPGFEACTSQAQVDPTTLTTAISDMETAYTDAAGRVLPDDTELGAGDISGLTIAPGLYKWGTGVSINTDVTLVGSANDIWIFQIGSNLTVASNKSVILAGGALPKNIFWQVAGSVSLATGAELSGNLLSQTQINMLTGSVLNGRALAQTQVTLDQSVVTKP